MKDIKEMCPGSSFKALNDGALLLDVREKDEFEQLRFDVPDMLHIPYSEFDERYSEVPSDRPVIVACSVGDRSQRTAYFLLNNGYNEVANLRGGLAKWLHKQYPVTGDKYAPISAPECCCSSSSQDSSETEDACCGGKKAKSENVSSSC